MKYFVRKSLLNNKMLFCMRYIKLNPIRATGTLGQPKPRGGDRRSGQLEQQ